ncbi:MULTISPECIES: hypothetical protein [Pseudomonas]|uniref:SSU ribosomal protein S2p (SAe) n=1 Tax=Pseudomonas putida TaxID=303 RepID=A0A1B2F854_PSEPU|nr:MULTISPECIES: hypothetical protein [Pseudomonas]ANY88345.1 hypothetical protein IEC33019_2803 [Pseudomonas putida]MCL8308047.1 hypothetical protein [Pseudomonas putida]
MSDARYFINPKTQTYDSLKATLDFSKYESAKFDVLNAHIVNNVVGVGEVVIMGDPTTPSCTSQEAYLMKKAADTHASLLLTGPGSDDFLLDNLDLVKSLLAHASLGIGASSSAWSKHLDGIRATLLEIEKLYQESLSSGTLKARNEFYARRTALFMKLEAQLDNMAAYGSRLRREGSVKRMLHISTKSYLHTGEIAGYAEKISGVAKASKLLRMGTPIGISLDVTATGLSIYKACTLGREDQCREAKYIEGGSLIGNVGGGAIGGGAGAAAGTFLCSVVFGIPTAGTGAFVCAVVGGAAGAVVMGETLGDIGGELGQFLYEKVGG